MCVARRGICTGAASAVGAMRKATKTWVCAGVSLARVRLFPAHFWVLMASLLPFFDLVWPTWCNLVVFPSSPSVGCTRCQAQLHVFATLGLQLANDCRRAHLKSADAAELNARAVPLFLNPIFAQP